MRDVDSDTLTALAQRALVRRNFIWITATDDSDESVTLGLWSDVGSKTLDVIDGESGETVSRTYLGSGKALTFADIPLTSDISVQSVSVTVSQLDSTVNDFLRANNIRMAPVEIHRGLFYPGNMTLIAPPIPRFLGFINQSTFTDPAVGQQASVELKLVSHTRELTRIGTDKRSDQSQQLRHAGDRFYQYTDVAGDWALFWGQNKGSAPTTNALKSIFIDPILKIAGLK